MSQIRFEAQLVKIGQVTLLRLPPSASDELPSRGMTMVKGTINGVDILAPLEPDGMNSHWLEVDEEMFQATGAREGDTVALEIEPTKEWTEPDVAADIQGAIAADAHASAVWAQITTAARWDWIRWISSTANQATRQKRIEVALSKMNSGMRRPCCFNRNICTVPEVAKNGILREADGV